MSTGAVEEFTAAEVAREAAILADRDTGPAPAMLRYCADVLRRLERQALLATHAVGDGDDSASYSVSDAARMLGIQRPTLANAVYEGVVPCTRAPGSNAPRVRLADVRLWDSRRLKGQGANLRRSQPNGNATT